MSRGEPSKNFYPLPTLSMIGTFQISVPTEIIIGFFLLKPAKNLKKKDFPTKLLWLDLNIWYSQSYTTDN